MSDSPSPQMKRVDKVLEKLHKQLSLENEEVTNMDIESASQEQFEKILETLKSNLQGQSGPGFSIHWSVYLAAFIFVFSFVGFFGYRLVRSLGERERKREEKKKLKEAKKKK